MLVTKTYRSEFIQTCCLQGEIHSLLLAFAEAGATVLRLKGGDPYVYGRGGEEVSIISA